MKTAYAMLVVLLVGAAMLGQSGDERSAAPITAGPAVPRFVTVDVFVDSGAAALAAWQVEFTPKSGDKVTLVGIEGGEHAAYKDPAHYDPAALAPSGGGRVVLAAFNTGKDLPTGRTRVARLHLYVEGGTALTGGEANADIARKGDATVRLMVAADGDGRTIEDAVASTRMAAGDQP